VTILAFEELSESFKEGRIVEDKILEALCQPSTLEQGLEEVFRNFRRTVSPTPTTYIVINNFEEQETNPITTQPIESKQLAKFSSQLIEVGLFEVFEQAPSFVPNPIHTIAHSKRMMWHKGKEVMKETNSLRNEHWLRERRYERCCSGFEYGPKNKIGPRLSPCLCVCHNTTNASRHKCTPTSRQYKVSLNQPRVNLGQKHF